jgi:hypothetical protein
MPVRGWYEAAKKVIHDYSRPELLNFPEILTERECEIIRHTLGLDNSKTAYRNTFNAEKGSPDYEVLESLVKRGFMIKDEYLWIPGWIYRCTDKARKLVVIKQ